MSEEFTDTENKIKEIVRICEELPENYREKSFDFLLNQISSKKIEDEPLIETPVTANKTSEKIPISIDVRAFLSQYSINEDVIGKLFLIDSGEIRPIYKISTTKKSKAQMHVALLIALENSIKNPNKKFEFSSEEIRQRCIDLQVYDIPNFAKHFKNNKEYFKSLDDLEHIVLSSDGKAELAEAINQIVHE